MLQKTAYQVELHHMAKNSQMFTWYRICDGCSSYAIPRFNYFHLKTTQKQSDEENAVKMAQM